MLILTTACIDEALKSSELRLRSRSCGPPAATAGALSKKVPASEPAPSLASTWRPRLSTGTRVGQARAASQHLNALTLHSPLITLFGR